ncbi:MAG: hypothetical protein ACJAZM_003247 [Cyclobacteriaceae bacterium]|jgi:hypothetical protein
MSTDLPFLLDPIKEERGLTWWLFLGLLKLPEPIRGSMMLRIMFVVDKKMYILTTSLLSHLAACLLQAGGLFQYCKMGRALSLGDLLVKNTKRVGDFLS